MYKYICIYEYMFMYNYLQVNIYIYVYVYVYVYVCMYICIYVYTYVSAHMCMTFCMLCTRMRTKNQSRVGVRSVWPPKNVQRWELPGQNNKERVVCQNTAAFSELITWRHNSKHALNTVVKICEKQTSKRDDRDLYSDTELWQCTLRWNN